MQLKLTAFVATNLRQPIHGLSKVGTVSRDTVVAVSMKTMFVSGLNVPHRALNPRQFADTPVTDEEKDLTSDVLTIPAEGAEDVEYGAGSRRVADITERHRKKIIK